MVIVDGLDEVSADTREKVGWEEAISELMTVPTPVHQATERF